MQQTLSFRFSIQAVKQDHRLLEAQHISLVQAQEAEQREVKQPIETGLELE
jgi:hypothetical protein